MLRRLYRRMIERALGPLEERLTRLIRELPHTSPATKVSQRHLYHYYRRCVEQGAVPSLNETGYRVFSQFEEDGKLLFIFAALGIPSGVCVDIGSGDGIISNCANLILNFGWRGTFFDGSADHIRRGRDYYSRSPDTALYPPQFIQAFITRENINDLLIEAGVPQEFDLLSIDIDGNDYWVWDAMECTSPKVVMIETHVEFGMDSIVVPYDADYCYPGKHPQYNGASPSAMAKLAEKKGYRLVGANDYGFNMIFVRSDLAQGVLPTVPVESVLEHPRNAERYSLCSEIKDWDYITV